MQGNIAECLCYGLDKVELLLKIVYQLAHESLKSSSLKFVLRFHVKPLIESFYFFVQMVTLWRNDYPGRYLKPPRH